MNIYISSTQVDLAEYRAQVAKSLRQTGHTVLQMEEYTAEETRPLDRCVKDVASADLYVGIFAWRYGYVPKPVPGLLDLPPGIIPGETSITEAEYLAAEAIPRLIFLLADSVAWPPTQMDAHTAEDAGKTIKRLRADLSEKHLAAFFTSPDHLAREVLSAVRRQELSTQLELKSLQAADAHRWMMNPESPAPHGLYDSTMMSITEQIQMFDDETYMIIDLGGGRSWWSTRLYFLASLLVDLTDVRLLVFVDNEKHLFGVSNALAVRDILAGSVPAIRSYEMRLANESMLPDLEAELNRRGAAWEAEMQLVGGEPSVKTWVRKQELRRFLGASLIQRAVDWSKDDKGQGGHILEVVDQIIKWPQDLVPLVRDGKFHKVVVRDALTEEVARIFLNERLRTRV
ncbi:MAG: DUF4062 domain-containing protein [Paracoccaceae bacterium]